MKIVLLWLLFVSIAAIVLIKFILNGQTKLFTGGAEIGDIVYNLSLDYIASYIFYLLVVYLPEQRNKKNIYPYIRVQTNKIMTRPSVVFNELKRQWGHELDLEKATEDDLNRMLSCANPYGEVNSVTPTLQGVRHLTWLEYLNFVVRECKEAEQNILMHPNVVDTGIISRVHDIVNSSLFFQVETMSWGHISNPDLTVLSKATFDWIRQCLELQEYTDKEMGPYLTRK